MARFKKISAALLLTALLASLLCPGALAARGVADATLNYRGIHIMVNGTQVSPCDAEGKAVEPFIIEGTTYLPVRAVAGALGLRVGWDPATSTVTLEQGGETSFGAGEAAASSGTKTVPLAYRDIQLVIDGETVVPTDANGKVVEPFIIEGTTYLPVRAVAGALGLIVGWDGATSTVSLDSPPEPSEPMYLLRQETAETRTGEGFATKTTKTMKTYLYDTKGNCTEMTLYSPDGTVTTRYSYDREGRPLTERSTDKNHSISYTYTTSGLLQLKTETSDEGGVAYEYTFDEADRVTKYTETYTKPNGQILSDSLTTTYRYDKNGRLVDTSTYWRNGRSAGEQVDYDAAGNIVKRTTTENHRAETWTFAYDKLGRLLSERSDDGKRQRSYNYDSEGNMTSCVYVHEAGVDTTVYTYRNDRMVTKVYAGADGSSENWAWTYADDGELLSESYSSGKNGSYTLACVRSLDGSQLRSVKTYSDGRTESKVITYDERGNVIARETEAPGLWERYTYEYTEG